MHKEYQTALGWKIFILVVAPPLCGLFAWLSYTTLTADPFNWVVALIMLPLSFAMIGMFVFGIIDMFVAKLNPRDQYRRIQRVALR
ncbi:MAG: hypothetical protein AAGA85_21050 [Bacteroidota bacterium]